MAKPKADKAETELYESRLLAFQEHSAAFMRSVLSDPMNSGFFDDALRYAVELIPAAQAGSILRRASDSQFHFVATYGYSEEELRGVTFDDDEIFFGYEQKLEAFIIQDISILNKQLDQERILILSEAGKANEILTTLVIPLIIDGKIAATFTLDNFDSPTAFKREDQLLAEMFASHVAVAMKLLDYSNLFKEIFYNVPFATLVLKRDLKVTAANATFTRMTGLSAEGLLLDDLHLLNARDAEKIVNVPIGESASWETSLLEEAGGYWCRLNVQNVVLDEPLILITFFDLTQSRKHEDKLRKTIDELSVDFYAMTNRVREKLEDLHPGTVKLSEEFSKRELSLLSLITRGLTNAQIADVLNLKPRTITNDLTKLYKKIDVQSRLEASVWARNHNIE